MVPSSQRSWRLTRGRLGCLAVLVAMAARLLLGGMMTAEPDRAERVALVAAGVLCSSSNVPADGHRRHHHAADLALCPATLALELPASILIQSAVLPPPASMTVRAAFLRPPGRGPPAVALHVGSPRGPPLMV